MRSSCLFSCLLAYFYAYRYISSKEVSFSPPFNVPIFFLCFSLDQMTRKKLAKQCYTIYSRYSNMCRHHLFFFFLLFFVFFFSPIHQASYIQYTFSSVLMVHLGNYLPLSTIFRRKKEMQFRVTECPITVDSDRMFIFSPLFLAQTPARIF